MNDALTVLTDIHNLMLDEHIEWTEEAIRVAKEASKIDTTPTSQGSIKYQENVLSCLQWLKSHNTPKKWDRLLDEYVEENLFAVADTVGQTDI
jgi:hypothetical protein